MRLRLEAVLWRGQYWSSCLVNDLSSCIRDIRQQAVMVVKRTLKGPMWLKSAQIDGLGLSAVQQMWSILSLDIKKRLKLYAHGQAEQNPQFSESRVRRHFKVKRDNVGWDEIIRLKERLEGHRVYGQSNYSIFPLHSMVPAADQRRVFVRPLKGIRKVKIPL